jgi:hypothetical protein
MTEMLKSWRTVCKLTDASGRTYQHTQWGSGVTNPCGVLGGGGGLCSGGFYHAYHTPEVAAFLNPMHANYKNPRFWLAEIRGAVAVDQSILKLGATEMRTLREIPAIVPTHRQRVVFAVWCAAAILEHTGTKIPAWGLWADQCLAGDMSANAAAYAANAADAATYAAAYAANTANTANAAAYAADAATYAANTAAYAAAYAADITDIVIAAATYALQEDV